MQYTKLIYTCSFIFPNRRILPNVSVNFSAILPFPYTGLDDTLDGYGCYGRDLEVQRFPKPRSKLEVFLENCNLSLKGSWNLFVWVVRTMNSSASPFGPSQSTQMTDFPLPFHTPEAWKRYLFRVEPLRLDHHRNYPPGGGGVSRG